MKSVYCAVGTVPLNKAAYALSLKGWLDLLRRDLSSPFLVLCVVFVVEII